MKLSFIISMPFHCLTFVIDFMTGKMQFRYSLCRSFIINDDSFCFIKREKVFQISSSKMHLKIGCVVVVFSSENLDLNCIPNPFSSYTNSNSLQFQHIHMITFIFCTAFLRSKTFLTKFFPFDSQFKSSYNSIRYIVFFYILMNSIIFNFIRITIYHLLLLRAFLVRVVVWFSSFSFLFLISS